jgi:hypothetical protein
MIKREKKRRMKAGKWRRIEGCKVEWQRERKREKWKQICKCVLLIKRTMTVIIMDTIIIITWSVYIYSVIVLAASRRIFKLYNPKVCVFILLGSAAQRGPWPTHSRAF